MTARDVLEGLSDTLLCDDRILSVPERELLAHLAQRARTNPRGDEVAASIAHVVGEIVAERAYGVLGDTITKRLLEQQAAYSSHLNRNPTVIHLGPQPPGPSPNPPPHGPQPPSPSPPGMVMGPQPPGPSPNPPPHGPQPPSPSPPGMVMGPQPPGPSPNPPPHGPQPPSPSPPGRVDRDYDAQYGRHTESGGVAVLESPEFMPAECVILDEFLAPEQVHALLHDTLARESEFKVSEVVSPGVTGGSTDHEHRRSRVLMDLGKHEQVVLGRLRACLPRELKKLRHDLFPITRTECQITASSHGDFFRWHSDNGLEEIASREITFVYFFHREPRKFRGGELRIYDSRRENGMYFPTPNYRAIVPEQNQLVLFVSSLAHEITPVECPGGTFADSRFTVNGWLHR